jgi:hypothetical protein
MTSDPAILCEEWFAGSGAGKILWRAVPPAAPSIAAHWVGDRGEELTLFASDSRTVDELLSADAAALLAGGTFRPSDPMRDGKRLCGEITVDARAGPAILDVAAIADDAGAQRLVLRRPLP